MSLLHCDFCHFRCAIALGKSGHCGIRSNHHGTLVTESWGQVVALAVDPVEKKPFYHVMPGSMTLSVALFGCNLHCRFCQNASISQHGQRGSAKPAIMHPESLADRMDELNLDSVSFTYSEPTVWQDWMVAAAQAVKKRGGRCFMVTNGSFTPEARGRFMGLIDGYNIDVKGNESFYQDYCDGHLEPVMDNIRALCRLDNVAVEICTLLIEGVHDRDMVLQLGRELADAGVQVWHLSRFFPAWQMLDKPPTSEIFLESMLDEVKGQELIPFCYGGNSGRRQDSSCPGCGHVLIARTHGRQGQVRTNSAFCPQCKLPFPLMMG